jgi:hypothetical protein
MAAIYTYSEARQNLATLLDLASTEGEVRIQRRDGQTFVLRPEQVTKSPLDVQGIDIQLSVEEIVDFIHEGRRSFI